MVSDAVKKYRDVFSFGLLAVALLYVISGLSLLVKSEEDSFLDFSGRAAQAGYLFAHPFVVIPLAVAVALAAGLGEASRNARVVVIGALVIGGIAMVLGLVSWFAAFAYDGPSFGGVITAGKIVAIFLGLAQLLLLGLALLFGVTALQSLPKRVQQPQQWGAQPAYGQQQGWAQPDAGQWGQPQQWGGQQGQAGQQQWGGQQSQQWGQHAAPQQSWAQPEQQQSWGQPEQPQQQSWAQPEQPQQQQSWGQPEQPQQQSWAQPEQPQQPQSWGQPEQQQSWAQPEQPQQQQSWGQPEQQSASEAWGQPAGHEAQSWAPVETSQAQTSPDTETLASHPEAPDTADQASADESSPDAPAGTESGDETPDEGQQDGWWQRPSP